MYFYAADLTCRNNLAHTPFMMLSSGGSKIPLEVAYYYFIPQAAVPEARCLTHSPGSDVIYAFSHLALVQLILLPSPSPDLLTCFKQEIVFPDYLCARMDSLYTSAQEWWEKEAISCQSVTFPSGLFRTFCCKVQGGGGRRVSLL